MNLFLEQVKLIHPGHTYHQDQIDILIKNGKIEALGNKVPCPENIKKINLKNACVSAGWMDLGTQVGEPGYEHREDLRSVSKAAQCGGYTEIACFPNTAPCLDTKSQIQYISHNTSSDLVTFHPIGAISAECHGTQIAEMIDMHHHGAVAFSDGCRPIKTSKIMQLALDYSKATQALIINQAIDTDLANDGLIHEGPVSMRLGMAGISEVAEKVMIDRDITLLRYTKGRLLSHLISSKYGAETIKSEKKNSSDLQASVAYLNLVKTDEDLLDFDINLKVSPPIRSEKDKKALLKAIKEGSIDIIVSNHSPQDQESKDLEFSSSSVGALGLQSCFAALNTFSGLHLEQIIPCISNNVRKVLNRTEVKIEKNEIANLTIFDPEKEWFFDKKENQSKSVNDPFLNQKLTGKALGVINNNKSWFHHLAR